MDRYTHLVGKTVVLDNGKIRKVVAIHDGEIPWAWLVNPKNPMDQSRYPAFAIDNSDST